MKYFNVSEFILLLKEELENYEHYQVSYSPATEKTMGEWVDGFMTFAGYADDEVKDDYEYEEYDDDKYYEQYTHEEYEFVTRKKVKSFREDSEW